jgi:ABC-type transporter Mla MlaB component
MRLHQLTITWSSGGRDAVACLHGQLDESAATDLQALREVSLASPVMIDASGVTFADDAGVQLLAELLGAEGVTIACASEELRWMAGVLGFGPVIGTPTRPLAHHP